jgi:hypothetical protein
MHDIATYRKVREHNNGNRNVSENGSPSKGVASIGMSISGTKGMS